jgi:hypothetical protein
VIVKLALVYAASYIDGAFQRFGRVLARLL